MPANVVSIVGARPQFVKAAVVSEQLAAFGIVETLIHTGQHYDANMSDVFFDTLGLPPPRHHLGIGGGSHGEMTGRQLIEIERCLVEEKPDLVLVYGDTNSTLAGALAAVKLHLPVAHVEAGLRSFNMRMPEEVNRIVTDRISTWLYAPSQVAQGHLLAEGAPAEKVLLVGDVMYDAALRYGADARRDRADDRRRAVVTFHRAENTDDLGRLDCITSALCDLGRSGVDLVFPIHPRTRKALTRAGRLDELKRHAIVTEPLGYIDMLSALKSADVVVTDSGGLQKEAYFLGVPCVTLRTETEWTETVELGWNRLVASADPVEIVRAVLSATAPGQSDAQPYGDGRAAAKIAQHIRSVL